MEDDSTYLTVVYPYPLNTNLHLPTDWRALALWLACCTGTQDVLRAMFHKPKAASMVLIEVDREFKGIDALLGMHSWSEFLLAPTKEEAGKSSKVFYCTYNNAKAVKDAGWNRVDVQEHWFQGWRLDNDQIKHPYPKTTYCDVPPEPKTGMPMCRHLPRHLFPDISPQQELPVPQVNDRTEDIAPTAVAMVNMFGIVPNPAFARSSGTPRGTEEGPSSPGVIPVRDQSRAADGKAAVEDNPWDGYDAFRPDPPTRVKKRGDDEWICPQHGPMCNPGICKALARVERDERWRKEREEREEATRKRKEAREMRARRRGTKLTRADGRGVPRSDRPRRLANGPRRGASSSGSETEGDGGHDQGSLRSRTESSDPAPPRPPTSPRQDSEVCTRTVISAKGGAVDTDWENPIIAVPSSSAPDRSVGANRKTSGNGDGDEIRRKHVRGRNEGKVKAKGKGKELR
jgi:hypothetical protein